MILKEKISSEDTTAADVILNKSLCTEFTKNKVIHLKTPYFPSESILSFNFNPSLKELPSDMLKIKEHLLESGKITDRQITIETSSPLVLILIPLLLPLRDRVQVKIILNDEKETISEHTFLSTEHEIAHTKRFKELLEAAEALCSHGIEVIFSRKVL